MTRLSIWGICIFMSVAGVVCGQPEVMPKAISLAQQGKIEDAMQMLTSHIEQKPESNDERVLLAQLFDYIGEPNSSIITLRAGLNGSEADLDLLAELLTLYERRAKDGPTVSYKRGSVCYSPSKDKAAENAFKQNNLKLAVETCEAALEIMPRVVFFQYHLALLKEQQEKELEAIALLKELVEALPNELVFKNDLSRLYWSQGMTNQAMSTLKAIIEVDGSFEEAQGRLAEIYQAMGDTESAKETRKKAAYFEWFPPFVTLPYTAENYELYRVFSGQSIPEGEGVDETLVAQAQEERARIIEQQIQVGDERALKFLASICSHHSDHGLLESKAFDALEANPEAGVPLLLELLTSGGSTCTMRQAAEALSRLKVEKAFDILIAMLPQDTRHIWSMNIAECLARMGDERAIPELLKFADVTYTMVEPEDDPMSGFQGHIAARFRAILALGSFVQQKDNISKELVKGTKNEQVALACYASLYRLTGDETYFDEVRTRIESKSEGFFDLKMAVFGIDDKRVKKISTEFEDEQEDDS